MTTARLVRPLLVAAFVATLFGGSFTPDLVRGDDLSQAQAQQRAIAAQLAAQKAHMAQLAALQADLAATLANTKTKLIGINSDLVDVKANIAATQVKVNAVQAQYNQQVQDLANLDLALIGLDREEQQKAADLAQAKALLADHIRAAYDRDRTSILETLLSAASFTDALGDIGNLIDFGNQDHLLANQIASDQATLFSLNQTTTATRQQTQQLAQETAAQKTQLDASLASLGAAKAQLALLQAATSKALALQQSTYKKLSGNAAALRKAINAESAAEAAISKKIQDILNKGRRRWRHPVAVQRDAELADLGHGDPGVRLHRLCLGAAARLVRPLSQWNRHRRPDVHPDPRSRRRPGRVRRPALGRGLGRDHRPFVEPADLVRPR